jgi:hypothetical protein
MHEDVGTGTAGVGDETETLLVVEPFDYSLGHADEAGFDAILCARRFVWGSGWKWSIAYWKTAFCVGKIVLPETRACRGKRVVRVLISSNYPTSA